MGLLKLIVVGDGMCGKTSLLSVFINNEFNPKYLPTVFDTFVTSIDVDHKQIQLALYDTVGQEDYDRLRPMFYPNTDVVLLCFSLDEPDTLENAVQKWVPEVRYFSHSCPIILVGTKSDLRVDDSYNSVSREQGQLVADHIGAVAYIETSAVTKDGVDEVFEKAARCALTYNKRSSGQSEKCCTMM